MLNEILVEVNFVVFCDFDLICNSFFLNGYVINGEDVYIIIENL